MRTPPSPAATWPGATKMGVAGSIQPMSDISFSVRSTFDDRLLLVAGSIRRFGVAETSQCDTDEPPWNGFGEYTSMRPAASAPAFRLASVPSVTSSPTIALSALPSAWVTRTEGIVIVGSAPPRPCGGQPGALSATMTPIAPASWQFFTLTTKPQVPRLTSAIWPARLPGASASHASLTSGDAMPSLTSVTGPVTGPADSGVPNDASPTSKSATTGALTCRFGRGPRKPVFATTLGPSQRRPPQLIADAARCAGVVPLSQCWPVAASHRKWS